VSFDGSANINLPGVNTAGNQNTTGSAAKLTTARTIALSGDVTGSVSFDGSANATITAVVVDDSHNHVISNVDGLQTALDGKLSTTGGTLTGNLDFSNSGTTKRGIQGTSADNDYWFIGGGGTGSNAGYLEIATGDDGQTAGAAEPIYVSQYGPGSPLTGTLYRRATLLDANGNTSFPGSMTLAGNTVWTSGNDGAGSGLDADLLDGLHASSFAATSQVIGIGQTWQNVKSSRSLGTAYQNTTGKPIFWFAYFRQANYQISSNGSTWSTMFNNYQGTNERASNTILIPNGWYYRTNNALTSVFDQWWELR
jgi:hypothetical protein